MRSGITELPAPDGAIDGRDRVQLATFGTRQPAAAYAMTLSASQASAGVFQAGLSIALTAAAPSAPTLAGPRLLGRLLTAASGTATSLVGARALRLTQALTATSATLATLVKGKGILKTLTVSAASAATLSRKTARVMLLIVQQGTVPTLRSIRHLFRLVSTSQASAASYSRCLRRTLTVSVLSVPTLVRSFGMRLTATATVQGRLAAPGLAALLADPFLTIRLFLLSLLTLRPKMLTPAKLLPVLDIVGASLRSLELQATSTLLTGVGAQIYGDGVAVYGTGNEAFILRMASAADAMVSAAQPDVVNRSIYNGFFQALNSYLSSQGSRPQPPYSNLDTFLTSLNTGAAYTALVSPNTAYLQWLYNSKQPTLLMQPANVYAPLTALGTAVVGAGAALTLTASTGIRTVNDVAGGLQGYAPSKGVTALITAPITGTCAVILTASGWNAQGQPVVGRTWTAALDNKAAGQSVVFVPTAAGDRISLVTALTGAGTAASGAFSLQSVTERSAA